MAEFKELNTNDYTEAAKLNEVLDVWMDESADDNKVIYKCYETKPKVAVGCSFNKEKNAFRFASVSYKGKKESPVYYYDIKAESLGSNSIHNVRIFIKNFLSPDINDEDVELDSQEDIGKFIDKVTKVDASVYTGNIVNLLLCEAMNFMTNSPYEDGHTAELSTSGPWDFRAECNKIITVLKDKYGNLKNTDIGSALLNKSLNDRLKYLEDKRESFLCNIE